MATVSKRVMLQQVKQTSLSTKMILYKNEDLVAVNKPAGVAVHSGPGVKKELMDILPLIQGTKNENLHLAHRIDKNTSGIVLLTRHADAAKNIATLFREHKIIKKYWAITVGEPARSRGSIQIPIGVKNTSANNKGHMHRVVLRQDKSSEFTEELVGRTLSGNVQLARTDYTVLSKSTNCSFLEVQPLTGFKHQIRVHLADGLLCPVLGDYKFAGPLFRLSKLLNSKMTVIGSTSGYNRAFMYLHAYQLVIPQDEGKPLTITAPPPGHFMRAATALGLKLPPTPVHNKQ